MARRATPVADADVIVNKPPHYAGHYNDIECIDAQRSMVGDKVFADHCRIDIMGYLWRSDRKDNPLQDLKKARFYLEYLISMYED